MANTRSVKAYLWTTTVVGGLMAATAAWKLPLARLDFKFLVLAVITVVLSSRAAVKIPRVNTNITVSDTFIFLVMLLYGSEAAILVAAVEGLASGMRISKTPVIILFNSAVMACSTTFTAIVLSLIGIDAQHNLAGAIMFASVMAVAQYLSNTSLIGVGLALKEHTSFWLTWKRHYLWTSITYLGGAIAAVVIYRSFNSVGVYALLVTIPAISIIYFTYHKYLEDIRATAALAEKAERERAELERQRAEQAEHHVQELNNYIAEQERISKVLEDTKEHFRHAAFHDSLTGLPNRAMFTELLKAEIESSKRRPDHHFAVLFLDLDRFKNINDSLGHTHGDLLLVAFAERLEHTLRPVDTLARFGGDEFAILLSGIVDATDAVRVAERIHEELRLPFTLDRNSAFATASIGIALSTSGYDRPEDILRDADTALYRAKENGKARSEMFDKGMHARAVTRLQLESDLRQAIEQKQFCVYYQPIVSLETCRLAGLEALVRWNHPTRGVVSPVDFVSVAEETGMIVPIGQWVLEDACRKVREWQIESPIHRSLTLSVNLSARQVAQPDLLEQIKNALERSKLSPHHLKLEITESVVMENAEAAALMLKQLRALGVQLSIDDFGTGYSSLSYLHRFPLNYLKIDRSFVMHMTTDNDNAIVRTISTLARNLGMEVIAEGIETQEQFEQLKALGCEYGQGFLFSRPVDEAGVLSLLAKEVQRDSNVDVQPVSENEAVFASTYQM